MTGTGDVTRLPRPRRLVLLLEVGLAFLLALAIRLVDLNDVPPDPDDLLHLYAARSYLTDGTFSIFSGVYVRAADYTRLVAASLHLFGDSMASARVPALISGAGLVAAIYGWMRTEVGLPAAVIAGTILALLAPAIEVSLLVRFYALQSLLFWLGAAALYAVVAKPRSPWAGAALSAVVVLAWAEAARLQVVSSIGVAGCIVWALPYLTWRLRHAVSRRALAAAWIGLLLAAAAGLAVLTALGITTRLYGLYRSTTFWAAPDRDYVQYYYHEMTTLFGPLLDLFPLAALISVLWHPRPALFCGVVFVTGFLLHSFAGMKGARYIFYLIPFFCCIWGMTAQVIVQLVRDRVMGLRGMLPWRFAAPASAGLVSLAVGCFIGLTTVKAVPVLEVSARHLVQPSFRRPFDSRDEAWPTSRDTLRPILRDAEVFVSDDDLLADFHLGRADLVLSKSRLVENDPPDEFRRDFRTGTPTISSAASIRTVLACFGSGLIVTYEPFLSWLSPEGRSILDGHTTRLDLARDFVGFVWNKPLAPAAEDCTAVKRLTAETASQRRRSP